MRTFLFNWHMSGTTKIQAKNQIEAEKIWEATECPEYDRIGTDWHGTTTAPVLEVTAKGIKEVGFLFFRRGRHKVAS
jgi:hypothetical protein